MFIFKAASTLTTAAASVVSLINGANACNVYWQVGSSAATLGTNSTFKGNILALASITLTTGANVEGRVLARNGAVTLDSNVITVPTCAAAPGAVSGGSGRGGVAPLIELLKTPVPVILPLGGGAVTYTYTVKNIGTVPMKRVLLTDDKCDSQNMRFISSDTNSALINADAQTWLMVGETWTYTCTDTIAETTTNTGTVRGSANDIEGVDTAFATVVVGLAVAPPLIHIVKKPNVFLLPAGGGAVTYSYNVTNPGTVALSDVSVIDNKCTGLPGRVAGHPGDINRNGLLDTNETFYFTCQSYLTQTTTNLGTAQGHANGFTAIDYAVATVVVGAPGLPSAGFGPDSTNKTLWGIVASAGIIAILSALYVNRKKQTE